MTQELELKPCPKCGDEHIVYVHRTHNKRILIECYACDYSYEAVALLDIEQATEVWNRMSDDTEKEYSSDVSMDCLIDYVEDLEQSLESATELLKKIKRELGMNDHD